MKITLRNSRERKRKVSRPAVLVVPFLCLALIALAVPARSANPDGTIDKPVKGIYPANSSFYQAHVTASDIDGDGLDELLTGSTNGYLYCFNARAELKWAYYVGASIQGAPACYDVDGDGMKEVWVGDMGGWMWGFDSAGRPLSKWGWPRMTRNTQGFAGIFSSPAVGDVTGDGIPDIVVGTYGHTVECWTYYGAVNPGWPYDNKDTIWSSPALADIDFDGVKEIIIGADSTGGNGWPYPPGGLLYVFNGDGSMLPGFPRVTPEVTWSSPAVADIDSDGRYEIIVGTGHYYKAVHRLSTEGHRVYAYNHDGTPVPGWPVSAAGSTFSSPAVGDINGDGVREIVIACNGMYGIGEDHIMAYSPDGRLLLDIKGFAGPMMGSPALGDITGDGCADILIGSGIQMCAWDYTGRLLWSQNMGNFVVTSPVVGDFDRDGHVEAAFGTGDAPGGSIPGGNFYVFDMGRKVKGAAGGDALLFPWSMFGLSDRHHRTVPIGNEPPTPPPPPPPANFHEYILFMNPGTTAAAAEIELMNERGETVVVPWTVEPGSRSTAWINRYMSGCSVSARVTSSVPIICERAVYFNFGGRWQGGHNSAGAPAPAGEWYLAEGYTAGNFDEYVLVQNPGDGPVHVEMTFMREGADPLQRGFEVAPLSRFTLNLKSVPGLESTSVSTRVKATGGQVIAERAMYFDYGGNVGGHNSIGVTEPSERWYLAEGYTAEGYDSYVLVQNPGERSATVELSFMRSDGHQAKKTLKLPPESRKTVRVDDVPGFEAAEVSTEVRADRPVIAERAMYFDARGRGGGHDSAGVTESSDKWYLAEGYTGGSFDTYVLIMNPSDTPAVARTTFMRGDGHSSTRTDRLLPRSRFTIHVDAVPGFEQAEVSTLVEGLDGAGLIAERAMYFVYNGAWAGGHNSAGVLAPSRTWYFAEGYTGM